MRHGSADAEPFLRKAFAMPSRTRSSYLAVLGSAICCYASLGAVVRIVPGYVGGALGGSAVAVGVAIGAPALTAVFARPLGGRLADARGTRVVVAGGGAPAARAAGAIVGGPARAGRASWAPAAAR